MNKILALIFLFFAAFTAQAQNHNTPDPNAPQYTHQDLSNVPTLLKGALVNCATGAGETPFSIQIVSDSAYNTYELVCSDSCSGYYTCNVVGGIGPFQFMWIGTTNGTPTNTQRLTEVCNQSQVQVIVTDVGQGVSCGATHTLNVPTAVTTINFTLTQPTCPTTCDGAANHVPIFGVAPYSFLWSNGNINQNASDLCLGSNTLTITDANLCTFDTTITILNPPLINANIVITDVTCDGAADAFAVSTPSGGNGGPYDFTWEQMPGNTLLHSLNGANSDSEVNLAENVSYHLILADVDGCSYDTIFTIPDVLPMTLTEDQNLDASCDNSSDGQIDITVLGGSGNYTQIEWFQGLIGAGVPFAAGPSLSQNNLDPNTDYFVVVSDDQGCTNSFQLTQVSAPPPFVFSQDSIDVDCDGNGNGSIDITLSGGTPFGLPNLPYNYTWTSPNGGTGLVASDEDQTGLSGGDYHVVWVDANGCTDSSDITINEPEPIYTSGVVTNVTCFDLADGTIDLTTIGGNGGYAWTWTQTANGNLVNFNSEDQMGGLDSASYSVNIIDAKGCSYDTTLIITKPGELFFNSVVTQMDCFNDNDGSIDNTPSNGFGAYTIDWGAPLNINNQEDQIGNLSPGNYLITLSDAGCDKDTTITIDLLTPLSLSQAPTNIACNGGTTGAIILSVNGGSGIVGVVWTPSNGGVAIPNNDFTPTGLTAGTYCTRFRC